MYQPLEQLDVLLTQVQPTRQLLMAMPPLVADEFPIASSMSIREQPSLARSRSHLIYEEAVLASAPARP